MYPWSPEQAAQVRLREARFTEDGADRAGRDVTGMHGKRDAPSSAIQFDPLKPEVRPALSQFSSVNPARRSAVLSSRAVQGIGSPGQSRRAASIEIETGRRMSPGCESRWLGMAAGR